MAYEHLPFDGGTVEYIVDGPTDAADLLLFHLGTPCAAVPFEGLTEAAAALGMRTAIYSRPGYGTSTRREGRSVADEARISAALADRLGSERFFTAGWSGGGPAALACAALLPDRVRAGLTLGSLAPWHEAGHISMLGSSRMTSASGSCLGAPTRPGSSRTSKRWPRRAMSEPPRRSR